MDSIGGFNSAMSSMAAYLDRPTLGGGYSTTGSYGGWMPGTRYTTGPTPDDSLGSLIGQQRPSQGFARLWGPPPSPGSRPPSLGYGNLDQIPGNMVTGGVTAYAGGMYATPQQAANPIQVIGGQFNVTVPGSNAAKGAEDSETTPIKDEVKQPIKDKLTSERGYTPEEADAVVAAAERASGGDEEEFKSIMSDVPAKPVATTNDKGDTVPVSDDDKKKWAEKYADWFARKIGGATDAADKKKFVDAIKEPGAEEGDVIITPAQFGKDEKHAPTMKKFVIETNDREDDYKSGAPLYYDTKKKTWSLDPEGKKPAEVTGEPPKMGTRKTTIDIGGKKVEIDPVGKATTVGQVYKVIGTLPNPSTIARGDEIFYRSDSGWFKGSDANGAQISALSKQKPATSTSGAEATKTLHIDGGGKINPAIVDDAVALTARLEEHLEEYKEAKEAKRVADADARDVKIREFNTAIAAALKTDELRKKFKVEVKGDAVEVTCAGDDAKTVLAAVYSQIITRDPFDSAFKKLPEGMKVKLNGKEIKTINDRWYDKIFRDLVSAQTGLTHEQLVGALTPPGVSTDPKFPQSITNTGPIALTPPSPPSPLV